MFTHSCSLRALHQLYGQIITCTSTCGTSNSFGKVRTSAESSADTDLAQQRRLALIFENIAQGVEPTIDDHNFASENAGTVTEFLNKAPLNS